MHKCIFSGACFLTGIKKPALGRLLHDVGSAALSHRSDPQYLHRMAAALIVSAQYGQSFSLIGGEGGETYLATGRPKRSARSMGLGLLIPQMRATIQPKKVQPASRFNLKIGVIFRYFLIVHIVG